MKKNLTLIVLLASAIFLLSSCQAIGDVFKTGMWAGVIVVVAVVVLVLWLIGKMRK